MKFEIYPPLTRREKQVLAIVLPVGCAASLWAGLSFGRWLFGVMFNG